MAIRNREPSLKNPKFSSFQAARNCTTIGLVWTVFLSRNAMSNRPNLTLDQQFFQELLSAAYTIQQHNERLDQAEVAQAEPAQDAMAISEAKPASVCPNCGAEKPPGEAPCERCGPEDFRPGERMQRKWASMWLMTQEEGLWPERSAEDGSEHKETKHREVPSQGVKRTPRSSKTRDLAASGIVTRPFESDRKNSPNSSPDGTALADPVITSRAEDRVNGKSALRGKTTAPPGNWTTQSSESSSEESLQEHFQGHEFASRDSENSGSGGMALPSSESASDDTYDDTYVDSGWPDANSDNLRTSENMPVDFYAGQDSLFHRIAAWRVKLRFHRADLYLGTAVFVAALALLWPAANSPQPTLSPWQRALVTLGIAEAAPPAVHFQGDPAVEVWVDPHSALYYCPGEEQYGKTKDGRFNSQRQAQMDSFEPAGRSACE